MSDDNHQEQTTEHHMIIINHIHPLSQKVALLENSLDHQDKIMTHKFDNMDERMGRTEKAIETLVAAVSENHELVKKIWNSMWGGGLAVVVIFAIVKFVLPYINIVSGA